MNGRSSTLTLFIPLRRFDAVSRFQRFVLRTLRRNRVFALGISATLALDIGALSAVFSAVCAFLLRPLPYRDADRLVTR